MTSKNHEKDKKREEPKNEQAEEKLIEKTETTEENEKIQSLEKEIEDYKEKLLRKAAEFENYKRRSELDQLNLLNYSGESLIIKLLPIIDDFERSLQHMEDAKEVESIKTGVKLVYDKLMKILDEQGVKKIEAIGQPFNVELHEAVMQKKDESTPPHTVLDELEKGYMYKDKVIRHTKVIVSEDTE
ncbi:MAG: nucleotide exchange factor GrpE [Ignavibacteriaceae bacterium]|jgi:molecular chaperone GrpE